MIRATTSPSYRAFTVIELLVVISVIVLLLAMLLPAVGHARSQAKLTQSLANLRSLGVAHAAYAAQWNDRQFTLVNDNIQQYGTTASAAVLEFLNRTGHAHPPIRLGWGYQYNNPSVYVRWAFLMEPGQAIANVSLLQPIVFEEANGRPYLGSFRLCNARQFTSYLNGRFYDRVFYAPKDTVAWDAVANPMSGYSCFDDPGEYCVRPTVAGSGDFPVWSSYILSPAAMYSPAVMKQAAGAPNMGWRNPWSLPTGFRSPSLGNARYASQKTQMIEHHWLQNRRGICNPAFVGGTPYGYACEPYYFNHGWESSPAALMYDSSVRQVGVSEAERADARATAQSGLGLWHRGTPFGSNGYMIDIGYDLAATSFHILTADGILGRDIDSR